MKLLCLSIHGICIALCENNISCDSRLQRIFGIFHCDACCCRISTNGLRVNRVVLDKARRITWGFYNIFSSLSISIMKWLDVKWINEGHCSNNITETDK